MYSATQYKNNVELAISKMIISYFERYGHKDLWVEARSEIIHSVEISQEAAKQICLNICNEFKIQKQDRIVKNIGVEKYPIYSEYNKQYIWNLIEGFINEYFGD